MLNQQILKQDTSIKSILDYQIAFSALKDRDTHYMAIGKDIYHLEIWWPHPALTLKTRTKKFCLFTKILFVHK